MDYQATITFRNADNGMIIKVYHINGTEQSGIIDEAKKRFVEDYPNKPDYTLQTMFTERVTKPHACGKGHSFKRIIGKYQRNAWR